MLKKSRKRKASHSRSPTISRPPPGVVTQNASGSRQATSVATPITPTFDRSYSQQALHGAQMATGVQPQLTADAANLDQIWRGFEGTANEQLPVWLSDQSLGGNSLSQLGLEAFMMPIDYDRQNQYQTPQIW